MGSVTCSPTMSYTEIMSPYQSQSITPLRRRTLAEQMADALTEAIVSGELPAGSMLPIEPALAAQFGVSRAVVRDATRMLAARGLVDARHGRGVFITESGYVPFSEALLLALRRSGATVWDVERFEVMILPEVFAEAARMATDDEIAAIRRLAAEYDTVFAESSRRNWGRIDLPPVEREEVLSAVRAVYRAIFSATHNAVLTLLADPLLRLRALRSWKEGDMTVEDFIASERRILDDRVAVIAARDPDRAREVVRAGTRRSASAEATVRAAMSATPIGETVEIPLTLRELDEP